MKAEPCEVPADLPPAMRADLAAQSPDLVRRILEKYNAANEKGREEIRAFFESGGPRRIHETKVRMQRMRDAN